MGKFFAASKSRVGKSLGGGKKKLIDKKKGTRKGLVSSEMQPRGFGS